MAWYNSNWQYRKEITIDKSKVSGSSNHSNFPILIKITDSDLKYTGNGGHVGKSNGGDILFTSADETTKLDHELQKYVSTTGEIIAWVKIPSLLYGSDTKIYVYYGYASASDQENASGVWSNGYEGVWHFEESSGNYADATGNNNYGTPSNLSGRASGKIGSNAPDFGGASDQNVAFNDSSLDNVDNMTFEGWAKLDALDSGRVLFSVYQAGSDRAYLLYKDWDSPTGFDIYNNIDGSGQHIGDNVSRSTATWYHVAWTIDGTNWKIFINGAQSVSSAQTLQISDISTPRSWGIGIRQIEGGFPFDGILDEVRLSTLARSSDWLLTQFNNQNSPGSFMSFGSEEIASWSAGIALGISSPGKILNVSGGDIGKFMGI